MAATLTLRTTLRGHALPFLQDLVPLGPKERVVDGGTRRRRGELAKEGQKVFHLPRCP
ncbi:MAG: hypothetical protein ACK5U0_15710 [Gemmatimonas sp.]|uniref:hypothetical protein n=1 Tax=Gemmatimonas sp. TaxID=1962908 RepID=UPI00391B9898